MLGPPGLAAYALEHPRLVLPRLAARPWFGARLQWRTRHRHRPL